MQIPSVCFCLEKALEGNWYYKKLISTGKLLTSLIALQIKIVLYRDVCEDIAQN